MKARCISTNAGRLPDLYLDPAGGFTPSTDFPLRPGKDYVVFALTLRRGGVWYYVMDEAGVEYPVWYPAPLFEVIDARVSRHWLFGFTDQGLRSGSAIFAFSEWARNPADYYDRLSDGEATAVQLFREYEELMTLEFRDSDVDAAAEELDDGWLLCPRCRHAWRARIRGEMVRCPGCRSLVLNPELLHQPGP